MQGYVIKLGHENVDLKAVHAFISESYWAKGIPVNTLQKAIENSYCFGVFDNQDRQVGFARVVTDFARFAYLADVYILESERGKGLSKWLMQTIIDDPQLQNLRRFMLATEDAHGLYEQFGFKALANPEMMMEINISGDYSN